MAHGMAGLKTMTGKLADKIIPVPTAIFSATTNYKDSIRTQVEFEPLLKSSFQICESLNNEVILFCGYFSGTEQIEITKQMYQEYQHIIKGVVIDPIMGDHGKMYVEKNICHRIIELFPMADFIIPNTTEVNIIIDLLYKNRIVDNDHKPYYIIDRYPDLGILISSTIEQNKIGVVFHSKDLQYKALTKKIDKKFAGTGDLLDALFIDNLYFKGHNIKKSVEESVRSLYKELKNHGKYNSGLIMEL